MERRQIVEAGQIVRLHEGTRKGCFAPIRNGQILRHDGILSRYQVALRREGGAPVGRQMAASACPLRFQPVSLAGGRLRAAHRRAAVVARQPPSRSMAGLLFLRGVGSLRAFVLSSSNVPGWVVSQPWWLVSVVVAFRRRFESPRAYRPAPRKRGACAADERRRTHDATPAAPSTASPGAHCYAYAPGNAPPAADFSECAPQGGTHRKI